MDLCNVTKYRREVLRRRAVSISGNTPNFPGIESFSGLQLGQPRINQNKSSAHSTLGSMMPPSCGIAASASRSPSISLIDGVDLYIRASCTACPEDLRQRANALQACAQFQRCPPGREQ